MSMGMEIVERMEALGLGTYETDLFLDELPDDPTICSAVFETGGSAPDGGFSVDGIQYEHPTVQLRFRGAVHDSAGPQARAYTAYKELMKGWGQVFSGTQYLTLVPIQPPTILERDTQLRVIYVFNLLAEKEPS